MGGSGVKRVDYTDGEISTVSQVCDGALQLHQVISPCERCCWLSCIPTTPGHLVRKMGPREKMHGNTVQLFWSSFHSPAREVFPLHASYCCMRFTCFPFSTANVNKSLSCTRKRRLPLRGASNNTQVSRHSSKKHLPSRGASNNMQVSTIHRYSNKTLD